MRERFTCHPLPVIFFLLMISRTEYARGNTEEGFALKTLMASADLEGNMAKLWSSGSEDPCGGGKAGAWLGVRCNGMNVTHLVLNLMNLTGFIPEGTVSQLTQLRVFSLSGNGLTGQIPSDLIHCTHLDHLYLRDNVLSGPIPSPLSHRLKRIDLSNNKLSGTIPPSLADIKGLLSLLLQNNMLEGAIPPLNQTSLADFNVSDNYLSGEIPPAISSRFSDAAFIGNALLCSSSSHQNCTTAPPARLGGSTTGLGDSTGSAHKTTQKKLTTGQIIAIVIASCAFALTAICLIISMCMRTSLSKEELQNKSKRKVVPSESREDSRSQASTVSASDEEKPRLVLFDELNTFRLENLLRASAESLGKGSLGCTYKAVMEDGRAMCVKRLKDLDHVARREFEEKMQLVGRLRHPNVVPLWAYYYAKEEKLLVYEYQPNGNLHNLLLAGKGIVGNGGQTSTLKRPLSWNARLRIAKGIAKGLAYLHHECEGLHIPAHGDIKASNILLDKNSEARIADFGIASLISGCKPPGHIQAPELINASKQLQVTQRADVYSFGVLLLELLTGRVADDNIEEDMSYISGMIDLPEWVNSVVKEEWSAEVFDRRLMASVSSEESLISMLQIAMACTSKSPEKRPPMAQVLPLIAHIHESEEHSTASFSTSVSHQRPFPFPLFSSDDSTMMSTQVPFYDDDHDVSFRF